MQKINVEFIDFTREVAEVDLVVTFVVAFESAFGLVIKWKMNRQLPSKIGSRKLLLIK